MPGVAQALLPWFETHRRGGGVAAGTDPDKIWVSAIKGKKTPETAAGAG